MVEKRKDAAAGGKGGPCVIGPKIEIRGNLSGDEDLVIEGKVAGQITLSKRLVIEAGGVVEASVTADELLVAGQLRGDVIASGQVTISEGASVTGKLRAPRISIEEGARFKGAIDMDVELPAGVVRSDRDASHSRGR
jgi:cytoskeletal protein CcmA (bactofilin family)